MSMGGKAEQLVGEKTTSYDALLRDYSSLAETIRTTADEQTTHFDSAQTQRDGDFEKLVEHLASNEDRQLILQALFRPASDGIVKDEGLPPSMFEFLTRQSKG